MDESSHGQKYTKWKLKVTMMVVNEKVIEDLCAEYLDGIKQLNECGD